MFMREKKFFLNINYDNYSFFGVGPREKRKRFSSEAIELVQQCVFVCMVDGGAGWKRSADAETVEGAR